MDDLGLDIGGLTPRVGPGRQAKALAAEFSHELTEAHLSMEAVEVQTAPSIKRLRDSHHALARCLATGMKEAEASLVTGYSSSRISVLKSDPQFAELCEFYRGTSTDIVADFRMRMATMGMDALAEMQERMEENPESFSPALLREIVKDMADRTGHAPQRGPTSNVTINMGLSERMAAARARVTEANPKVIDHE
jgi:hypothetical protein